MEDSVMNSLAELWHNEDDQDGEVDLLILQQRDRYVASVREAGADKPVCEVPKIPFPYDECEWDFIDDTSGKLLKIHLSRRQELRTFWSFVNLVSGRLSTDPSMRSCVERDGLTSTRETKANRATAVAWSCKSTKVKQIGHFSQRLHRSKLCEVC